VKHLKPINRKAGRIEAHLARDASGASAARVHQPEPQGGGAEEKDVVALGGILPEVPDFPHIPLGCSLVFFPGWEADETGGTAGLCQPVERDLFDCHLACFWPAHVPDQLNSSPDWTGKCAAAQKDWRKLDLIFP
jgi:hypothetical protein